MNDFKYDSFKTPIEIGKMCYELNDYMDMFDYEHMSEVELIAMKNIFTRLELVVTDAKMIYKLQSEERKNAQ